MSKDPQRERRFAQWLVPVLLAVASVALFLGLFLPFFHVTSFWIFDDAVSAVAGIIDLFEAGEYFLFLVIGIFTIVFPISKIVLLAVIWMDRRLNSDRAKRLQIWVSHLGKWSMLDVFVVAVLIVMIRTTSGAAELTVGIGLYLFTLAVILNQVTSSLVDRILRTDEPGTAGELRPVIIVVSKGRIYLDLTGIGAKRFDS